MDKGIQDDKISPVEVTTVHFVRIPFIDCSASRKTFGSKKEQLFVLAKPGVDICVSVDIVRNSCGLFMLMGVYYY